MALSFSLGVSFAPISPSNTPDALISDELSYTKRYEGKIKTTRRHAGKHSSYLGNKIDDRGLNEHHVNFDKPSLEDLGRGDGAITHDAPTTAPNSGNIDEEEEHLPAGQHLLVDIKNVEAAFLNSEERLAAAMVEVVTAGGLTLLSYHCHSLIPAGVSCVGVLLESHISFHTWPDEGVITLDMFTCGAAPLLPVVPELKRLFGPPRESKNGTQEEVKAQWSHELRGFRNSEGYKKAGYLDSKSELASMVISPLDVQVKNEILSHSTKYQRVDIWEYLDSDEEVSYKEAKKHNFETNDPRWMTNEAVSPEKWLFLNGQFQISDVEAVEDSEALVHPPMFVHEEPERVAIFNSPDGSILREVLKHDTVEEVVVFEVDKELMELCREHFPEASDCSNIEDSEDSCFDDERTSVIYEDGKKWFVENFPDGKKVKEDDKFDVIIIEEFLAEYRKEFPEYDIPYDKVVSSLFNGLDTSGVIGIGLGGAPTIHDPKPDFTADPVDASAAEREKLINAFENHEDTAAMFVYEEAHSGLDEPLAFLIVCREAECRSRWNAKQDAVDYWIYERTRLLVDREPVLSHYDGTTQTSYFHPPKAWETVYCRREPTPFECDYIALDVNKKSYDFNFENEVEGDFELRTIKEGTKTKNSVTALFARTDISEGSYILPSSMATSFILNGNSLSNLENNLKIDGTGDMTVIDNFLSYVDDYGHESMSEGSEISIVEVGASQWMVRNENKSESNVGRWMPDHPSGKIPKFSPVYDRHMLSFDVFIVATKDIKKGEELVMHEWSDHS